MALARTRMLQMGLLLVSLTVLVAKLYAVQLPVTVLVRLLAPVQSLAQQKTVVAI